MSTPPGSSHRQTLAAERTGARGLDGQSEDREAREVCSAPEAKAADIELHVRPGDIVWAGQPLCRVHAEARGEANIEKPLIIGPDSESKQWVAAVASDAEAPYRVLEKVRHGDRDVRITLGNLQAWQGRAAESTTSFQAGSR